MIILPDNVLATKDSLDLHAVFRSEQQIALMTVAEMELVKEVMDHNTDVLVTEDFLKMTVLKNHALEPMAVMDKDIAVLMPKNAIVIVNILDSIAVKNKSNAIEIAWGEELAI